MRRIGVGEQVMIGAGDGRVVHGTVTEAEKSGLVVCIDEIVEATPEARPITVVQALAKGDRAELAVETMTEVGVTRIRPWQASRCIVKWQGDRGAKALNRWRSTAREATKQSRRVRVPEITEPVTTTQLCQEIADATEPVTVLVLHESAEPGFGGVDLPGSGEIILVVGPEGGITDEELDCFVEVGAHPVCISDGVLRTSTAGAAATAILRCP